MSQNTNDPLPPRRTTPVHQYDPTAVIDSFSTLKLDGVIPPEPESLSKYTDPTLRVGTSMSTQSDHRGPSLPVSPSQGIPSRSPPSQDSVYPNPPYDDSVSYHSGYESRTNDDQFGAHAAHQYWNDPVAYTSASYSPTDPPSQYHQSLHSQAYFQPPEYSNFYSAASDVLGMAPPPGQPQLGTPSDSYQVASSYHLADAHNPVLPPPGRSTTYPIPGEHAADYHSGYFQSSDTASITAPSINLAVDDIEMRPRSDRINTGTSVSPRTTKTKAVDLSAPPYTKEYIDQYRMRIKDDPDPEAHFLYAKYLIDAAKKIGANAKDQRSVKKYRDLLVQESLKVIRRLATQGEAYDEAQFFLANCYGTGMLGLQVDHERAYHLYLQAAKQNHPAACYRVAVCNEIGAGTKKEPDRASAFYRKAASLGDTAAMYKLGVILLHGTLAGPKNPREAIGWLQRAAEQADEENPHALHELALLYANPGSQVVPFDPAYARELFTRAGHLGYTHSQFKLGQCYEYGSLTCPIDPRRSIAWYTKAAEKGHGEAELALSGWYLTGSEGVLKQSDSEAYLWARRAANRGLSKAEYAVGYYAEVGIGVKQDVEFAKRWYMRSAGTGFRSRPKLINKFFAD
ncbi:HCP-like protein [Thelephora ganbajun]|uniref:HCP-like protein n=1 Tax=Thelephora ganbajun TaxID=370292 RepID=A0ACB6ZTV6_THEGA|nr:HCP-like protein [Thelephora ganbajun]